jgi:hypothetical protein
MLGSPLAIRAALPNMNIFDDIPRKDAEPPLPDETQFAYLNRSARPEAERVRNLIDEWFAEYPETHRDDLIGRFRSAIDDQHKSAFFELFLHRLVLSRGCKVLAIEPRLDQTDKSPDFLVETAKQERFYLEAAMATGRSNKETAAQARLNSALSAIDSMPSPAHFLDLTVHGVPSAPISIKKLKRELQSWIAGLPKDESAGQATPFIYEEHGAKIRLRAWTRNKWKEGGRAIGVRHSPIMRIAPHQHIHTSLKRKASRYGLLDHPYLLALNAIAAFHAENAVLDALLGTPYVEISTGSNGKEIRDLRKPDGIWFGPGGQPQNTRLSGVLALARVDPWNFASKGGLLIPNPWATKPFPQIGLGTAELTVAGDTYKRLEGSAMSVLLGLPASWPEG